MAKILLFFDFVKQKWKIFIFSFPRHIGDLLVVGFGDAAGDAGEGVAVERDGRNGEAVSLMPALASGDSTRSLRSRRNGVRYTIP